MLQTFRTNRAVLAAEIAELNSKIDSATGNSNETETVGDVR